MWNFSWLLPRSYILSNQCWLLSEARPQIRHDLTRTSSSRVLAPTALHWAAHPWGYRLCSSWVWFKGHKWRCWDLSFKKKFILNPTLVRASSPPQCFYALGPQWWYILQMTFFSSSYTCTITHMEGWSHLIKHKQQEFALHTDTEIRRNTKHSHLTFYASEITPKQM